MKDSARVQAVIDVLQAIDKSPIPMDKTIGDYMRARRYIGSKDRAYIVDSAYKIMRAWDRLHWHLEQAGADVPPSKERGIVLLWLLLFSRYDVQRIGELFNGELYAPEALSDQESAWLGAVKYSKLTVDEMPGAVKVECPPQYEESLRGYFGDAFEEEMRAFLREATLDLRVNTNLKPRDEVRDVLLQKDRVDTDFTPYSPWGLRAKKKIFLSRTKAFVKGWVDIQDEGSQLIAYVCGVKPGMQVLDYCAGGGGKTLALAAAMKIKGRIVACDIEAKRLEKSRPRFKRAGVSDIVEVRPLEDKRHQRWFKRQVESFDVVLLDVPCSGTGTWRRNPDTRWVRYGPKLPELLETQKEILEKTAKAVKLGGRLVYATCSILPEENEQQVEAFLATHPEFKLVPLTDAWPGDHPPPSGDTPYMRLTPHRHNTDGFFAAVLEKIVSEKPDEDTE